MLIKRYPSSGIRRLSHHYTLPSFRMILVNHLRDPNLYFRPPKSSKLPYLPFPSSDSMSIEPTQSPSEPEVHSGEDFVHIEDPRPTGDISLSDSIVNVEKDELLDDEAEEEFKDSDSVVSGGDGIDGGGADDGECSSETTKVELPEELAKSVVILTCESTGKGGSCDVYLIGTAHVSKVF